MCLDLEDGKKIAMPRYYKDKIYTHMERSEIAGYQKGEIEKRTVQAVEQAYANGINYARDKKEAIAASYRRMYKQTEQSRNKI